ncbi:alpha/beta hydrolase [Ferrimonas lipolytica]|uniref:Alpha/beta fold hydrolase n=1 Tax=Ferrimonas lipolytica TaxID=2724191 RepID=A0A6H1UEY7_9GAMM|nr:alpha/beta fold hydrolase [Ferrimonas lipolytica]QIZ76903.1 alpha/beta fold hydrolase [Ferrimonas lipolytica]
MMKIALSLLLASLLYLAIAMVLVWLPIKREQTDNGLHFDQLTIVNPVNFGGATQYFIARDGKSLFYRQLNGGGELVIILLHGSGTEGRYLLPLAQQLNQQLDATVVVPDLRGHGKSSLTNRGDIDYLGQFTHDLDDLNSHLRRQYRHAKFVLGGHSSGGGLAIRYGGEGLQQMDGYLLLAPYLGYQAPTVRENSGGWVQVVGYRYAGLAMLNNIGITQFNDKAVLFFNRPAALTGPMQAEHYSYRLNESLAPQDYGMLLGNNKAPILVLVGAKDESFYADRFESTFAAVAPHAKVQIITNVTHLGLPNDSRAMKSINQWVRSQLIAPK